MLVGSARIDENGNIRNGKAGDQTGREVCVENYYTHSQGWITLRAKETKVAEKIAEAMEKACANDAIGYDQYNRDSLYNNVSMKGFDPSKATACETDCSALVRVCLAYAGIMVRDFNTSTEKNVILGTGKFNQLTTSASTLKRGDILVTKTQGHTVVVLGNKKEESKSATKYYPDISHHHPVTDWNKVKAECPFLISKATQGTSFVDSTLKSFIDNCERLKIPYWLYTYLNFGNEKAQAEFMVKTCKDKVGSYFQGYILDVEEKNTANGVRQAMEYLLTVSKKIMVYTMYSQYSVYAGILANRKENVAWWEARYGLNNGVYNSAYPCHAGVDFHQYTSNGSIPGITPPIDLNRLTGRKGESWFTSNATPTPTPNPTPSESLKFTYAVKAGGTRLPAVVNLSDYAGVVGKKITDIAIKVNKGSIKYRVHVLGGKWLPYVTGYDWSDYKNGYAGNGKPIDAIEVILAGSGKARYRVSPVGKSFYPWQNDNEKSNGQDGYAGSFGVAIDRFQIYL